MKSRNRIWEDKLQPWLGKLANIRLAHRQYIWFHHNEDATLARFYHAIVDHCTRVNSIELLSRLSDCFHNKMGAKWYHFVRVVKNDEWFKAWLENSRYIFRFEYSWCCLSLSYTPTYTYVYISLSFTFSANDKSRRKRKRTISYSTESAMQWDEARRRRDEMRISYRCGRNKAREPMLPSTGLRRRVGLVTSFWESL